MLLLTFTYNWIFQAPLSLHCGGGRIWKTLAHKTCCIAYENRRRIRGFSVWCGWPEALNTFQRNWQRTPVWKHSTMLWSSPKPNYNDGYYSTSSMNDVFLVSRMSVHWLLYFFCLIHCNQNLLNKFSSGLQEIISLLDTVGQLNHSWK